MAGKVPTPRADAPGLCPACEPWLRGPLLVGLSGGRDSVALLRLLAERGCRVAACHVHHGIRGADADADAAFCRELCASLGVPLRVERVDAPRLARERGESLETAARLARRSVMAAEAKGLGAAVALAHHADDQAETVLFRLARGSAGPRGMRPVLEADGVVWLRPLLEWRRAQITAWLETRGFAWREDATNADDGADAPARNRLRHEALPALDRALGRDVTPILNRSARLQQETLDALDEALALLPLADPQGRLYLPALAGRSAAFRRAAVRRYLSRAGVPGLSAAAVGRVEALLDPEARPSRLDLGGGWRAARRHRRLELTRAGAPVAVRWTD